ncbi:MAG: glycine cleavage T C-terminal barrel domain-containing protein, partial [Pseudomonadota bacterium]
DLPGVMQASALRGYINGFAARPFSNSVIFANNDDAWKSAFDLLRSGGQIALIVDVREDPDPNLVARAKALGIEVLPGHVISRIRGSKSGVEAVEIACLDGRSFRVCRCDSVAMSGGFAPTVHLFSQSGGTLTFDEQAGIWLGDTAKQPCFLAGMAAGHMGVLSGLKSAIRAGAAAANAAGFAAKETIDQKLRARFADFINEPTGVCARRIVPNQSMQGGKAFIDLQNDVTTKDLSLAWQEGYRSGEHLKRYTTLGMGTDQGKTANVAGHAMMAGKRSLPAGKAGLTTFRPPYVPVGVGLLAGGEVGEDFRPLRRTPMDSWHEAHGAEWMDAGLWRRPRYHRSNGNTLFDACKNEVRTTRSALGMADISTLGKITLAGPDTAEFLNRIYANAFAKLPVGKARYGLMLREDGILFDDGTTARLSEDEYYMTTTTANAAHVMEWLDYYLQIVWPDLRVFASSVSEQWAAMSIAGPHARDLLAGLVDIDLAGASFPFMAAASCKLGAIAIRLLRISFSGELAFEIHCPADYGLAAWQMLESHGQKLGICTYGLEALGTMRIEKGHPAGGELDGTTTLADLGLAKARKKQGDYVGRLLEQRPALQEDTRLQLVGVQALSEHSGTGLRIGAQLAPDGDGSPSHGHVTASAFSPELGKSIGLALLQNGRARIGEQIVMCDPLHGRTQSVEIVPPCFIDREGVRQHA